MTARSFGIYALDAAAVADTLGRMTEAERHWVAGFLVIAGSLEADPVALMISPDGTGILIDSDPDRDRLASNWRPGDFEADAGEDSA